MNIPRLPQTLILTFFLAAAYLTAGAQVHPDRVDSAQVSESIQAVLDTDDVPDWFRVSLPDSTRASLASGLKAKTSVADTLHIGRVQTDEGPRYIIPDIAPSRSEHFSYLLYLDGRKQIAGIDILEYRENYGYEIDYPFFREQFHGMSHPRKILFGRTIQNISGATISARSLTWSVHDLMLILNTIKLPG